MVSEKEEKLPEREEGIKMAILVFSRHFTGK